MLPLAHTPAKVLAAALIDLELVSDPLALPEEEWPVYVANEPWWPDNLVTLSDTQGQDFGREGKTFRRMERCGIQVRIRARTYPVAMVQANALCLSLDRDLVKQEVLVAATPREAQGHYLIWSFVRSGMPIPLNDEASGRSVVTLNGTMTLKQYVS